MSPHSQADSAFDRGERTRQDKSKLHGKISCQYMACLILPAGENIITIVFHITIIFSPETHVFARSK